MTRFAKSFGLIFPSWRLPALFCMAAVCISTFANAQDLRKPGEAHQLFARDAGTWDCDVKMFHKGPKGPPTKSKGVEVNQLVCGGLYMQTSFTFQDRDRKFEGHSLMGYDPRSKKYVGTWVDNFTSVPSQIKGVYNKKAKTLTVHSVVVDGSGNEIKSKQITTWLDESRKKLEIFMVVEVGDKAIDIKLMEMMAKKRK